MVRVVSFLLGAALVTATPAFAQPRPSAAAHFDRGQKAQAAGNYREAITEYEAAQALIPHPDTLYNIAVCYEALDQPADAIVYYRRYLADAPRATDAAAVRTRLAELERKVAAAQPPQPPPPPPATNDDPTSGRPPSSGEVTTQLPPLPPAPPQFHFGGSYGLGFGDVPVQRAQLYAGKRLGDRLELDGVFGGFGKNDYGIGVLARLLSIHPAPGATMFVRGAATVGYAKQDGSPQAGTRFPLGLEAGVGGRYGKRGWIELTAVVRAVFGGWDAESTMADSFVNDRFAFAIDLCFGVDWPLTVR